MCCYKLYMTIVGWSFSTQSLLPVVSNIRLPLGHTELPRIEIQSRRYLCFAATEVMLSREYIIESRAYALAVFQ